MGSTPLRQEHLVTAAKDALALLQEPAFWVSCNRPVGTGVAGTPKGGRIFVPAAFLSALQV